MGLLGLKTSVAKALSVQTGDIAASAVTLAKIGFNATVGVAGGYKIARGNIAVTGNATDTTGLTTLVDFVAGLKTKTAGSVNKAIAVSAIASGTEVALYCWKASSATRTILIPADQAATISWIAVGT